MKRKALDALVAHFSLTPSGLEALLTLSDARPARLEQLRFGIQALRIAGLLCLVLGVIFFVAANWSALQVMGRFALLEILFVGCIGAALVRLPPATLGRFALFGAFVVAGALLALFGQTYQTGANVYELFLTWALLGLPLVIASQWSVAWAAWFAVLNIALALYCGWRPDGGVLWFLLGGMPSKVAILMLPAAINLALWFATERIRSKPAHPALAALAAPWLGRFLVACAIGFGTWAGISALTLYPMVGWVLTADEAIALILLIPLLFVVWAYTMRRRKDVFPLTMLAASMILLGLFAVIREFHRSDWIMMLLVAVWLVASSTLASKYVLRTLRQWRTQKVPA